MEAPIHLLIDADSLCYKAGFVCNQEDQERLACWQVGQIVNDIVKDTNCETYKVYLSGSGNFRYSFYPEYKGNRVNMVRPIHLQAMREFLVTEFGATVSDGTEADDELGIAQCTAIMQPHWADQPPTAIAAIDKDLDMIPGLHYNYNKKTWNEVGDLDAMRWFFYQLIMGDRADNIPGFDGKMRNSPVPKFLQRHVDYLYETDDYDEMLTHVFCMYNDDWDRFNLSARCLWIWRKEQDNWQDWQNPETLAFLQDEVITTDFGPKDDSTPSSLLFSAAEVDDGDQSTPF